MTRRALLAVVGLAGAALVVLGGASVTPARAAGDCPRGALDARFCDRDGDMLADPALPGVDPPTLVFAYTPLEDPAVYRQVWQEFLDHLAKVTGRKVVFFPVQSNAAEVEAMRAGRLHVAGFNTGTVPLAVNLAGFVPLAMMARGDGSYGYEMQIVVRADSPARSPADLRGKTIAFTSPTSNSGYKAPVLLLKETFGLVEKADYKGAFSGKHDNSVLGVVNGDYAAAAVASTVLRQMEARRVVDPAKLRVIFRSETFPTTAYGVANTLAPDLARKVREAFFSFKWDGTALAKEFGATEGTRFVPASYLNHWAGIRRIDAALGVTYAKP